MLLPVRTWTPGLSLQHIHWKWRGQSLLLWAQVPSQVPWSHMTGLRTPLQLRPQVSLGSWALLDGTGDCGWLLAFLRCFVKLQIKYCWGHLSKSNGDKLLIRFSLPGEEAGKSLFPGAFILILCLKNLLPLSCFQAPKWSPQTSAHSGINSPGRYSNLGTSWKTQKQQSPACQAWMTTNRKCHFLG